VSSPTCRAHTRIASILVVVALQVCAASAEEAASAATTGATVRDGVFTSAQSLRGEQMYMEHCKRCHLRDLSGDYAEDAPALTGEEFLENWDKWSLGDLFDFMQTEMPPKEKDRTDLAPGNYADILAFILQRNGFPAGAAELPPAFDPLSEIEMYFGSE
jgi:cytochrome c